MLYIPSFSEILAVSQSRGEDSTAPHQWRGLIGAWPFQEGGGSTAFDVSGFGHNGTLTNMDPATDWVVGDRGLALDFVSASSQYVSLGFTFTYPFTVLGWVRIAAQGDAGKLWGLYKDNIDFFELNANAGLAARWEPTFTARRSTLQNIVSTTKVPYGDWACMAAVGASSTDRRIYVFTDKPFAGARFSETTGATDITPAGVTTHRIGGSHSSAHLMGRSDGLRIYDRAISFSEFQQIVSDPWAAYRLRRRRVYSIPEAAGGGFSPFWASQISRIIGGGVC